MAGRNNRQVDLENFTLGLALWDLVPVLLFLGSTVCIASVFKSFAFFLGAGICIISGFGKVLWKFLLALKKKNVQMFSKQMRFMMPTGFFLMLFSLIIDRKAIHFAEIWKLLRLPYIYVPFLIAVTGFAIMFFLSRLLNQENAGNNKLEQTINVMVQFILLCGIARFVILEITIMHCRQQKNMWRRRMA